MQKFDGDTCFSTDYEPFIKGKIESPPILYVTSTATKKRVTDTVDILSQQAKGFGTKVGFLTNVGSTISSMLSDFLPESREYKILNGRYKFIRVFQGYEIDKQKGLLIPDFPDWWTKRKKYSSDFTDKELEDMKLYNSVAVTKRPYFFRYLYEHMSSKWKREFGVYNNVSWTVFGKPFDILLYGDREELTDSEAELVKEYLRKSSFVDNDSVMNRVSHYMEKALLNIKLNRKENYKFDYRLMMNESSYKPVKMNIDKIRLLYREYKSLKRDLMRSGEFSGNSSLQNVRSVDDIGRYINNRAYATITSNSRDMNDLAVYCVYNILGENSKAFLWDCFGTEIIETLDLKHGERYVRMPKKNKSGSKEYLFTRYEIYTVSKGEYDKNI